MDSKALEAAAIELRRMTMGYCKPWENESGAVKQVWRSRALSAIEAYEKALWRPVSEHDGSRDHVLLWPKSNKLSRVAVGYFYTSPSGHSQWIGATRPTHFRPLPQAPEER